MINPYNSVLLNLVKSNLNLQFVTEIYGLLAYLCSYLCKEEGKLGEIMRNVVKELPVLNVRQKMRKVGNVLLTKCEPSTHESIKRNLSLTMRLSNIGCDFIFHQKKD